jgi:chromosome partitioning protein
MKTIAFFNNKGGVGKTSLVYHLAWMFAELRLRTVAIDLDPQANLTSNFLDDEQLSHIWLQEPRPTVYGAISPIFRGVGDISTASIESFAAGIGLVVGDLALSKYEDELSAQWPLCLDRQERAFRVTTAFSRLIQKAGKVHSADVALVDVGPNLGALNRCALIACDYVVTPLGPDLFSLQGLRNMGPVLQEWRDGWAERILRNPDPTLKLPSGAMQPVGYIVMRHSVRLDRPVQAYARWIAQMPTQYRESVLGEPALGSMSAGYDIPVESDPYCLAQLKDYRSLMPMAQENNKPMFLLKPADGAIGGHQTAVQSCYQDFRKLAMRVLDKCGIPLRS